MKRPIKGRHTARERVEYRNFVERFIRERDAARAKATKKSVSFDFIRGDLHMHSVYSDGWNSVDENVAVGRARGLDFIFITDHNTVRQKVECKKYKNVWWGQEPSAGPQHVCMLDLDRKFTPTCDMKRDAETLREMGVFFFYPHPFGN